MKQTSRTPSTDTAAGGSRARTLGTVAMAAGALFAIGALGSTVVDWAWFAVLLGFALLAYVVSPLHRLSSPSDGWPGRVGSLLVLAGAVPIVALGGIFLVWEAVGTPGDPAWAGVVWIIGFFAFLTGTILFAVGAAMARTFPPGAPVLVLVGLVGAIAFDMASGAFFSDDEGITPWGFYIGVPVFGLGLAWMGYAIAHGSRTRGPLTR